jgi:preprotein translocase subunit SecE
MGMKLLMIIVIIGFGFALWGIDSIITKFENKSKTK